MPLKIAIAGAGMIANAGHIPAWKSLEGEAEVMGVYNPNLPKAESTVERHRIPKTYDDFDKMIAEIRPDVLSVCTPNTRHTEYVQKALATGAHVLCEKPITTTVAEARCLYQTARENSAHLVAAQTMRFTQQIQAAHDIASTGVLGEMYYAEAAAMRRRGTPTWGRFHIREDAGGGPLFDLGVHVLDSLIWVMDNPRIISASGATYTKIANRDEGFATSLAESGAPAGLFDPRPFDPHELDVEDMGVGFLRTEGGGSITLKASWAANVPDGFGQTFILGTESGLVFNPLKVIGRCGSYQAETVPKVPTDPDVPFQGHRKLARHVVNLIAGKEKPVVKPEEVINVINALEALYRSAQSGREEKTS